MLYLVFVPFIICHASPVFLDTMYTSLYSGLVWKEELL